MKTFLFLLLACLITLSADARLLTDQKGRKADLKLLGWNGELVKVQNKAGKTNTLRIDMLSERDQTYVRENVKKDLSIAERIPRRTYNTTNGKSFEADLIGLRGEMVELKSTTDRQVQLPISFFAKADQDYIVEHAPLLDSLNANPEVRHSPIMLKEAVGKIDQMMDRWYEQQKVQPNAVVDDGTFLRRAYLTVIGRVPTKEEAQAFLDDRDVNRREKLIDRLFEHDGYVHHMFNYYADLLRIKSRNPGRNYGGAYYAQWVKDSVRENRPYDHFVQDLLSAKGYYWEDPAVGFYRRDPNMPLDNLAVMTQTLLGTSIVCAQCHDHPFDRWTQKEYYEMAAYTYPMVTRLSQKSLPNVREAQKLMVKNLGKEGAKEFDREHKRLRQNMIDYPLQSGVAESDRRLRFPKDYAYANAAGNAVVAPQTPFGSEAKLAGGKDAKTVAPFVEWFTSPENPRFARNIANRLWKEAFGLGLIEPVDDIRDSSQPFNPELMDFLTRLLVSLEFDTKTYLKVLMKTRLFEREAYRQEVNPVDGYAFTGPLLRRMTAEQIWDSMLTMILPDVDHRINKGLLSADASIAEQGKATLKMKPEELYVSLLTRAGVENPKGATPQMMEMMEDMSSGSMKGNYKAKSKGDDFTAREKAELAKLNGKARKQYMDKLRRQKDPWYAFDRNFYRAAEQPSPAPAGHFLNLFGQSDREMTENDNQEASIPQVLTLMNNTRMLDYMLTRNQAVMFQELAKAKTPKEKVETIFLCTYSRYPYPAELDVLTKEVEQGPEGIKRVFWAVLNSQSYRFVE
ncbi:MAG: hypothetical protein ACI9QL_002812 [Candidatus Omnitrophota bacterium]|jgi:hypothetical protein